MADISAGDPGNEHFLQVRGDLAHTQAVRLERQDAFVKAGQTALVFGDQLRGKARVPITRHGNLDCAKVAGDGLGRLAITHVAAGVGYREPWRSCPKCWFISALSAASKTALVNCLNMPFSPTIDICIIYYTMLFINDFPNT